MAEDVLREILVSSALKEEIVGPVESLLLIVITWEELEELPLVSVAVKVNVCVVFPNEKSAWSKSFWYE